MAGVEGIEPPLTVLETVVIPLDHTPVGLRSISLLGFFDVCLVLTTAFAEFFQLQFVAVLAPQVAVSVVVE